MANASRRTSMKMSGTNTGRKFAALPGSPGYPSFETKVRQRKISGPVQPEPEIAVNQLLVSSAREAVRHHGLRLLCPHDHLRGDTLVSVHGVVNGNRHAGTHSLERHW